MLFKKQYYLNNIKNQYHETQCDRHLEWQHQRGKRQVFDGFWLKCIDNCLLRAMKNALAINSLSKDLLFEKEPKVNMVTLNKMDKIMRIKNISKKMVSAKAIGAYALGARAIGAGATGAFALGCIAIGSIAIGAFYLGRLSVKKASFGDMRIGKLTIEDLEIINSKINVDGCADGKEI